MRSVVVDKIASVALAADLGQEIRVSDEIPCEEGVLIAVEVENNKSRYNTLELTSGRMAEVKKGDVVVGALGHRKALFGYSGHLPTALKPGDTVQLLNLMSLHVSRKVSHSIRSSACYGSSSTVYAR